MDLRHCKKWSDPTQSDSDFADALPFLYSFELIRPCDEHQDKNARHDGRAF
jgi:hypothetical protein